MRVQLFSDLNMAFDVVSTSFGTECKSYFNVRNYHINCSAMCKTITHITGQFVSKIESTNYIFFSAE